MHQDLRPSEGRGLDGKVGVANQLHRLQIDPTLPQWVYVLFSGLGVVGLILGISGLSLGLRSNFMVGMSYFMLGVCCEGLSWSLKKHFEEQIEKTKTRLAKQLEEINQRIAENDAAMDEVELVLFGPKPVLPEPIVPIIPVSAAFRALSVDLPANYAEGDAIEGDAEQAQPKSKKRKTEAERLAEIAALMKP